jgi:hypothetical protein
MFKIVKWIIWLWSPFPDEILEDEPEVVPLDELGKIRQEKVSLKSKLSELEKKEEEVELALLSERADDLLDKLLLFQDEVKSGDLKWKFREVKKCIDSIRKVDSNWTQFLNKHYERKPEMNNRQERAFFIHFCEALSNPNKDLGDAIEYLAKRRRPNNPFLIKGIF